MTKSERIRRALSETDKTREQIARDVGCLPAYVRVVEQRLLGGGLSKADRGYRERNAEKLRLYNLLRALARRRRELEARASP